MKKRHPHVTHLDEVEPRNESRGKRFQFTGKRLGAASGGKSLGCSWYEVPPGKCAFPNHYHCANEESMFVLEGTGELRIGKDTVKVGSGDYIALPPGPESSHSLTNSGEGPLRYLCMSTLIPTEVVGYPDSNKYGFVGAADISKGMFSSPGVWIRKLVKEQANIDYYDGEKLE